MSFKTKSFCRIGKEEKRRLRCAQKHIIFISFGRECTELPESNRDAYGTHLASDKLSQN